MNKIKFFMGTVHGRNGLLLGATLGNVVVVFDYSGEAWDPDFNAADLNKANKSLQEAVIMNYIFKNITGPSPTSMQGTFIRSLAESLTVVGRREFKDVGVVSDMDNFRDVLRTWKDKE